jgi:hypothetical protein
MPNNQPLTIATYAAGASLAAITLVYVFGPTFLLDGDQSANIKSSSRRPAVGLHNPANGMHLISYGSNVCHGNTDADLLNKIASSTQSSKRSLVYQIYVNTSFAKHIDGSLTEKMYTR